MARILLGVSGGIAAYKALELARLASARRARRTGVMTEAATRFVAHLVRGDRRRPRPHLRVRARPAARQLPRRTGPEHDPIGHLELAASCDAYLVAPASANTLAKLAAGVADSMLTTSFLACAAPRLVAPAMNDRMYADAATQANVATLRERGVEVIEPDEGGSPPRRAGRGRCPTPPATRPGRSACRPATALGRAAGPGHRRRDPRADRPGPLHRQPLQRPHGYRPRGRSGPARRGGDVDSGQRGAAGAGGGPPRRRRDRRQLATATRRSSPPPTSW